ncbi:MAG: hypothetical protein SPG17_05860 [Schaalia hyovaginalis]|uniref:hypothetical protein n=1 Tax=Schaalia hyovaginalis TaxID=29316 RepID=UPI0023F8C6C3|nr:hypothetical protein [Schaalia hyovaginalis]MCI7671977.1 hypothetical protein [Schaalia hyovaginalis]MDY5506359.1 hypothetical protein [Schaalia hyovaginalis]
MNTASLESLEETRESAWAGRPELMERGEDGAYRLIEDPDRLPFAFIIDARKPQSL